MKSLTNKRAKACDIPKKVKDAVWERDGHCCIICGSNIAMPNAHYISRNNGGLGIEENIVTLCTNMSPNKCHYRYDFGSREEKEEIRGKIRDYLADCYNEWSEDKLIYNRFGGIV